MLSKCALALIARIIISVYLDDRNLVAPSIEVFEEMFRLSSEFDILISSEFNEAKCQIYPTDSVDETEYEHILPEAERTQRPWSPGFALPSKSGGNSVAKTQERCEKTMQQQRKPTLCRTTFENEFYEQFIPRNTLMAVNTFTSTSRNRAKFRQNWKQPYGVVTEGPEVRRSYGPSSTVDTPFCRSTLPPHNKSDSFLS